MGQKIIESVCQLCPNNEILAVFPADAPAANKFTILRDFDDPILENYALFLRQNGIEVAGIEFVRDRDGRIFTYDVNTNTKYNAPAEAEADVPASGMQTLASYLGEELAKQRAHSAAA